MKKLKLIIGIMIMVITITNNINAETYTGRKEALAVRRTIDFEDVLEDYWARETIVRSGALNIVKGFNNEFRPLDNVSNEEAIVFIIRGLGLEQEAIDSTDGYRMVYPDLPIENIWSLGYLNVALEKEMIDGMEYASFIKRENELTVDEVGRKDKVTRETVIKWIIKLIEKEDPEVLNEIDGYNEILRFSDWRDIKEDNLKYIEKAVLNNIVNGSNGRINPDSLITRAEMVALLNNIKDSYYKVAKLEEKTDGIENIESNTEENEKVTTITMMKDEIKVKENNDIVVYKDKKIGGIELLNEDDEVTYIVNEDNEVLYIKATKKGSTIEEGYLEPVLNDGKISIKEEDNVKTYDLNEYLYREKDGEYQIAFDNKFIEKDKLPISQRVKIEVRGNVVINITKADDLIINEEINGVVVDFNPLLSYITILNEAGEVTKNFERNKVIVEKQKHTDLEDEIGYIDEMFPHFEFDERDASINDIEIGDIVYLKLKDNKVTNISAKTNYKIEFVTVRDINETKDGIEIIAVKENKQIEKYDINNDIFISKFNQKKSPSDIVEGDYLKLLINEAFLKEGTIKRTVKEVVIDGNSKHMRNIYRGNISFVIPSQNKLIVNNIERYSKLGWSYYNEANNLIYNNETEYYEGDEKVNLDYISKYLSQYDGYVYIGTTNFYNNEIVRKVTFRDEREYDLNKDEIIYSNGKGEFRLKYLEDMLKADDGTIIKRYDRLVDKVNLKPNDFAKVYMNGDKAALIDIQTKASTDAIDIFRGRIKEIETSRYVTFKSFSELENMDWIYSTVDKKMNLGKDVSILSKDGIIDIDDFVDYGDDSVVDEIFTFAVSGNEIKKITEGKFVEESVKGELYDLESNKVYLKDSKIYRKKTGKWEIISIKDDSIEVDLDENALIIKNDKLVNIDDLELGDKLKVMTDENFKDSPGETTGYIIYVEG